MGAMKKYGVEETVEEKATRLEQGINYYSVHDGNVIIYSNGRKTSRRSVKCHYYGAFYVDRNVVMWR